MIISFNNTEIAFKLKSNLDLRKAIFLFQILRRAYWVKKGKQILLLALKLNLPIENIIKNLIFNHFCGGISIEDCQPKIEKMYSQGVYSILDYSAEAIKSETLFDDVVSRTISTLTYASKKKSIPFIVFKPTGLGRADIFEKKGLKAKLSDNDKKEWEKIVNRYYTICKKAHDLGKPVMIDAEESWIQNAADSLATEMMEKFNTDKVIVFNTLQFYRSDRLEYLKKLHLHSTEKDFKIGIKIVRGAYMEKERERAKEMGYKDPICENKVMTDKLYNQGLEYMFNFIEDFTIFIGTHNEYSTQLSLEYIKNLKNKEYSNNLWFGQLYGMSDHLTYNLANYSFNTSKYLPYGKVKEVIPYLLRRAEENTSVKGQTSRELELLKSELKRRKN